MKKIFFFALLSAFTLATTSCNKDDATEIVDKTEYKVTFLVHKTEYVASKGTVSTPLDGVEIKLLDYGKTCTTKDGKAELNLPQGEYRITVEKEDYDYDYSVNSFGKEKFLTFNVYGNTIEQITLREKD
jgi:hypothetical protein